jgi:hypothetical protein
MCVQSSKEQRFFFFLKTALEPSTDKANTADLSMPNSAENKHKHSHTFTSIVPIYHILALEKGNC